MKKEIILQPGEFFHKQRFGPEAVNRGAVLLECEWCGGIFEAGVMLGGLFRSGEFRGGTFWGGLFLDGEWIAGGWECGFDSQGRYRPRTDHPPHKEGGRNQESGGGRAPTKDDPLSGLQSDV